MTHMDADDLASEVLALADKIRAGRCGKYDALHGFPRQQTGKEYLAGYADGVKEFKPFVCPVRGPINTPHEGSV